MSCAGKAPYLTEADALAEVAFVKTKSRDGRALGVYSCLCGRWHLTSAVGYTETRHEKTRRLNPSKYDESKDPRGFSNAPRMVQAAALARTSLSDGRGALAPTQAPHLRPRPARLHRRVVTTK